LPSVSDKNGTAKGEFVLRAIAAKTKRPKTITALGFRRRLSNQPTNERTNEWHHLLFSRPQSSSKGTFAIQRNQHVVGFIFFPNRTRRILPRDEETAVLDWNETRPRIRKRTAHKSNAIGCLETVTGIHIRIRLSFSSLETSFEKHVVLLVGCWVVHVVLLVGCWVVYENHFVCCASGWPSSVPV
jgi:hypothetical protein